jgi:antitoxin component of RelBE/YafQ-DinJ toxin-antitoxin module
MEAKIMFRIDEDLKREFEQMTTEMDITPSQLLRRHVRELVAEYQKKNSQLATIARPKEKKPPKPAMSRQQRRALERTKP